MKSNYCAAIFCHYSQGPVRISTTTNVVTKANLAVHDRQLLGIIGRAVKSCFVLYSGGLFYCILVNGLALELIH